MMTREKYGFGLTIALLCMLCAAFLLGCQQGSNIGDGKVDQVEAATIQVAVGLAMTARPDTVAPAYAVSTAILAVLDTSTAQTALAAAVDTALTAKLNDLHLDAPTKASVQDLALLIRAQVMEQLSAANIPAAEKRVVIREVVAIVQRTAAARLGVAQPETATK